MPVKPYPYFKFVQGGTLADDQDWSVGMHFSPVAPVTPTVDEMNDWLALAEANTATWWNTGAIKTSDFASTDARYLYDKLYYYPESASVASLVAILEFTTARDGTGGNFNDTRSAIVVSQLTGIAGRSFRGRRYLPADGCAITNHQLNQDQVNHLAAADGGLWTALNAQVFGETSLVAVIANNRDFPTRVISTKCDSKLDTQRRRSNKVAAAFTGVGTV